MKKVFYSLMLCLLYSAIYSQTSITFKLEGIPDTDKQSIGIRGNTPPLNWNESLLLNKEDGSYSITIEFPKSDQDLEFKFLIFEDDKNPEWESIPNRILSLSTNSQMVSLNKWNQEQIIDIQTLKPIPSDALMKDFQLIKTMVLGVHPGTYRYNTKEEIYTALDELESKFKKELSHQEAYLAISKLTAQLQCDHTKAGFNNQGKIINSIIHYQKDKVPFTFKWIDDQMVVVYNASNQVLLEKGAIVYSLNGIPVKDIKNQMMSYIGADGATDANRIAKMEVTGYDFRYNAFIL